MRAPLATPLQKHNAHVKEYFIYYTLYDAVDLSTVLLLRVCGGLRHRKTRCVSDSDTMSTTFPSPTPFDVDVGGDGLDNSTNVDAGLFSGRCSLPDDSDVVLVPLSTPK